LQHVARFVRAIAVDDVANVAAHKIVMASVLTFRMRRPPELKLSVRIRAEYIPRQYRLQVFFYRFARSGKELPGVVRKDALSTKPP
jgi:hypothetical protein